VLCASLYTLTSSSSASCLQAGKQFDVVVVDSRPLLEGRRMLTTLLEAGVTCEYCHLGALSYEMTEVDKVWQ
jgi:translation initiation factor eIF-2B subunit delta